MDRIKALLEELKDVKLVAVTKTASIDDVKKAKDSGLNVFGENRVQDAEEKIKEVEAEWHMIGHLQSNKIKKAVELFDVIESVDMWKTARVIDKEAGKIGKKQKVMVQVNIGREEQKYGVDPDKVLEFLQSINHMGNLRIIGLMCIAPHGEDARPYFKKMKEIFDSTGLKELSMGMTNDYKVAVEEGATMVRVGRKIFG